MLKHYYPRLFILLSSLAVSNHIVSSADTTQEKTTSLKEQRKDIKKYVLIATGGVISIVSALLLWHYRKYIPIFNITSKIPPDDQNTDLENQPIKKKSDLVDNLSSTDVDKIDKKDAKSADEKLGLFEDNHSNDPINNDLFDDQVAGGDHKTTGTDLVNQSIKKKSDLVDNLSSTDVDKKDAKPADEKLGLFEDNHSNDPINNDLPDGKANKNDELPGGVQKVTNTGLVNQSIKKKSDLVDNLNSTDLDKIDKKEAKSADEKLGLFEDNHSDDPINNDLPDGQANKNDELPGGVQKVTSTGLVNQSTNKSSELFNHGRSNDMGESKWFGGADESYVTHKNDITSQSTKKNNDLLNDQKDIELVSKGDELSDDQNTGIVNQPIQQNSELLDSASSGDIANKDAKSANKKLESFEDNISNTLTNQPINNDLPDGQASKNDKVPSGDHKVTDADLLSQPIKKKSESVDDQLSCIIDEVKKNRFLRYAALFQQVAQKPSSSLSIQSLFKNNNMLKDYQTFWKKVHKPTEELIQQVKLPKDYKGANQDSEKKRLLTQNIESKLCQFKLFLNQGTTTQSIFPNREDQKRALESLISQEWNNTSMQIKKDIKKPDQGGNDLLLKKLQRQFSKKKRAILYGLSKKVYCYIRSYMNQLYDDTTKVIVTEGDLNREGIDRQDMILLISGLCREDWKNLVKYINEKIPDTLWEEQLKPIQLTLGEKSYHFEKWASDETKDNLKSVVKKLVYVFTPPLLSIDPEYVIDPATSNFEPTDKMIVLDKEIYSDHSLVRTRHERKTLETLLKSNKTEKKKEDYFTLDYYLTINLVSKDGVLWGKRNACFSLNRSLLGLSPQ